MAQIFFGAQWIREQQVSYQADTVAVLVDDAGQQMISVTVRNAAVGGPGLQVGKIECYLI